MNRHILLLGTLVVVSFHTYVLADVIHVPGDYPTIQEAIDASSDGDEVVIADGTYTGPGNRDIDFGGRLITVRSENGPANCIIDCEGSEADPHRGFDFHHGETTAAVVQGLTIRNAHVLQPGGAVVCWGSSPTINNCVLTGNSASSGGGVYSYYSAPLIIDCTITGSLAGGGIRIFGGNPVVTNCTIVGNYGSGLSIFASDVVITDCTITGNNNGSGMYIYGSNPVITNCVVTGNTTISGGGIYCAYSNGTITSCTIAENTAFYRAGGILLEHSNTTVRDCTISGNIGSFGGGVYSTGDSSPQIANCLITDNMAPWHDNYHGGVGGGFFFSGNSSPLITNCIIIRNSAELAGGGIYSRHGNSAITNCTITQNSAVYGGGIASAGIPLDSGPLIANSILWNDSAANGPEIAVMASSHGDPAALTVRYSNVENGQGGAYVEPDSELNWGGARAILTMTPCGSIPTAMITTFPPAHRESTLATTRRCHQKWAPILMVTRASLITPRCRTPAWGSAPSWTSVPTSFRKAQPNAARRTSMRTVTSTQPTWPKCLATGDLMAPARHTSRRTSTVTATSTQPISP